MMAGCLNDLDGSSGTHIICSGLPCPREVPPCLSAKGLHLRVLDKVVLRWLPSGALFAGFGRLKFCFFLLGCRTPPPQALRSLKDKLVGPRQTFFSRRWIGLCANSPSLCNRKSGHLGCGSRRHFRGRHSKVREKRLAVVGDDAREIRGWPAENRRGKRPGTGRGKHPRRRWPERRFQVEVMTTWRRSCNSRHTREEAWCPPGQ